MCCLYLLSSAQDDPFVDPAPLSTGTQSPTALLWPQGTKQGPRRPEVSSCSLRTSVTKGSGGGALSKAVMAQVG